jgi:TonB-linked SusC/RagA family outer membrane protein
MKKILQNFLWVLLLIGSQAYAQGPVSGRVTGKDDGQPLAGVSVTVKGSKSGTQTGPDGRFTLNVSTGTTLVFSFIGYVTEEAKAGGNMSISLIASPNQLNDVVVVPYGTARRETFTGSSASISSKDITNRPITNGLSALAGVAPGVVVNPSTGQPGSSPTIRIRGFGSINASNDPLIIVDGVQFQSPLSNINPEDIENLTVLKDAASTALYGSKAANGVIIVTTKRGKKGVNQINIKATQGINFRGIPEYDRLDAYEYYPMEWMAYRNSLVYGNNLTPAARLSLDEASIIASGLAPRAANGLQIGTKFPANRYLDISQTLGNLVQNGVYTQSNNPFNVPSNQIVGVDGKINPNAQLRYDDLDWLKDALRTSDRKDYTMTYNGATDKSDFYVSMNYLDENGFANKSDFRRVNARANVNTQATKWFKTGLNLSGTYSDANTVSDGGGSSYINPFFFARSIGPVYNVYAHDPITGANLYDALGAKVYDLGGLTALGVPGRASGASPGRHVIQEIELNDESYKRNFLSGRTYGEISFLKHFKFTANFSADHQLTYTTSYQNQVVGDGAPGGRASRTTNMNTYYNLNQLLDYNQSFGKSNVSVLVGHESYGRLLDVLDGSRNTQIASGNTELANFTTTSNLTSYKDRDRTEGIFSRINYDYDQKYLLSANLRRDGSSRFGPDVRWGTFGGVSLGWRLDREDFLRNVSWIDNLKIRTSYGTTGNYNVLNNGNQLFYLYQTLYNISNNAFEPGYIASTQIGNLNAKWEVNKTLDAAIEFGFFKNRLSGSIEVFDKRSSNLLFNVPQPLSSGYLTQTQNIGEMYNKGIEFAIAGDPIRTKNFVWNVNFNATMFENKITKMPEETPFIINGINRLEKGHSIYDQWTRLFKGVDPADGASLYVPVAGATTDLRVINGVTYTTNQANALQDYTGASSIPDVAGGLTNSFTYKGLTLTILTNYQLGGQVFDSNYQALMSVGSFGSALHKDALKSWMNPGDITDIPRLDQAYSTNLNATSSRWTTSASYLYLRSTTLNYAIPNKLTSKLSIKNARVYVSGENLYVFTARKGLDPTYSFAGTVSNTYVPQRTITLGLNFAL